MSRMRQIPAMDVSQREKMLEQNQLSGGRTHRVSPPVCNTTRPVQGCRPRVRRPPVVKFRLSDAPSLISTGCNSVRQLCNNVQNITMDLNNLMGSVESMVPLLNSYLTVLQSRSTLSEQELDPPIEVIAKSHPIQHDIPHSTQPGPQIGTTPTTMSGPMPRPEDIQTLLENPFVRNLLSGFMQNGAVPNISAMKEPAPHQS